MLHLNGEGRRKEARNLFCLVNRQFLGGYKTLGPIYWPPPSGICLGGWGRRRKGWQQLPQMGKIQSLSAHLNLTTPCKHTENKNSIFQSNCCLSAFPFLSSSLVFLSLGENKERGEARVGTCPTSSLQRYLPSRRQVTKHILKKLLRSSPSPMNDSLNETSPRCHGERQSQEHFLSMHTWWQECCCFCTNPGLLNVIWGFGSTVTDHHIALSGLI